MQLILECIQNEIEKLNKKYIIDEDTFKYADESHLLPFIYSSMDKNTNERIKELTKNKINAYLLYDSMQQNELNTVKDLFQKNQIRYSILKGIQLQKYYPDSYYRYMGDIDILVDKKDLKRAGALLKSIGYSLSDSSNHDITFAKGKIHIEVHYKLIPEKIFGSSYLNDPFTMMENINHSEYVFKKKEDEYIYYLFHLLRHYETSGIGLRNFIDLYLYKKNNNLDMKYIEDSYKYTSFIDDCYYLNEFIDDLFNDDNTHEQLIERILNNKTFGTTQELTKNELENKSTFRWLLRRMFPTITQMKNYYKCLMYKICYLFLPLLYIHHIFYFGIVKFKYSINRIKLAKRIKKQK